MTTNGSDLQGFFKVGGAMGPDEPSYVERTADETLPRLILAGHFCHVLTARQLGKSSLMVRTAQRLAKEGVRTASVELTAIGTTHVTVEVWYLGLIHQIQEQLELAVDYQAWWEAHSRLSPVQRFSDFLRQVVLEEITGRVVIFIDEIDSTLNLDFSDDFFAAIRAAYNVRASDPAYERLSFVLLGVAMPGDLIADRTRTPFNIGKGVDLQEFSRAEAKVLQEGLEAAHPGEGETIFARIYHWSGGHPYLTQRLCEAAAESGDGPWTEERVDALVEVCFLGDRASRKDGNLSFVRHRIQASPDRQQLLRVYRRVRRGGEVADEGRSAVKSRLKLIGLVRATDQGTLVVRNRVYEQVFNLEWVREAMPWDLARWAVVASLVAIMLALAVVGYFYWYAQRQTPEFLLEQFRNSQSAEVRVTSLAGLVEIEGCNDAQALFFEELSPEEQVAMFGVAKPVELQDQLVVVVGCLYTALYNTEQNNILLESMQVALSGLEEARDLSTAIEHWRTGRRLYSEEQYGVSELAYSDAITPTRRVGETPALYIDRALARVELGKHSEAREDFDRARELDPEDTWARNLGDGTPWAPALEPDGAARVLGRRALTYYRTQQWQKAWDDFTRLLKHDPDSFWALARRGECSRQSGEYEQALTDFNAAHKLKRAAVSLSELELGDAQDLAWVQARRGATYRAVGEYPKALDDLNAALSLNPEDDWALSLRGDVCRELGRYDEALDDFTRVLEINPNHDWALARRAETYRLLGRYEEAMADFDQAINLNPVDAWALAHRAETNRLLGRHAEALADFNQAIDHNPDDAWALAHRAETYRLLGRYEQALAEFNQSLELEPDNFWTLARRGECSRQRGEYEQALADFNAAHRLKLADVNLSALGPGDARDLAWIQAHRGATYRTMREYQKALDDLNSAVDLNPEDDWALHLRGDVHRELGRYDEALADFTRVLEINPNHDWALARRGETYRLLGRYEQALADFNDSLALKPRDAWALAHRGETYRLLGLYAEALADFQMVLEVSQDPSLRQMAEEALRDLAGE